jgi:crotonobetainyl-CoA:carnitine CoA-transferase CaiB-like acyl-CoA transferase
MAGVKIVEVALYAFGPAAAAVLCDWGADVIKVEHPIEGDPVRGLSYAGIDPGTNGFTYLWEIFNRGKRSIGVDLSNPDGHALLLELVREADVFLTSFLPPARRKLNIDVDDIRRVNPNIVYARASGYGPRGPDADKGGYDAITYWHRAGISAAITPGDAIHVAELPGPAFGDLQGAIALAGGIAAALFERQRTGEGCVVDSSLMAVGMWAMHGSLVGSSMLGTDNIPSVGRFETTNPLVEVYRTADARFVALSMLQADRYWSPLCDVLGRPDLAVDPRFVTMGQRRKNARQCVAALDEIFANKPLRYWEKALAQQDGQWEVVRRVGELNTDEQAWANGYLTTVDYDDGRSMTQVSAPVLFNSEVPTLSPAPEIGAGTEEILLALGKDWNEILRLKDGGAIS